MGLYKLKIEDSGIESGILEEIKTDKISFEKDFENWLENSPYILFEDEDEEDTVIWICRQIHAPVGNTDKYPDLIGVNSFGDLVIVELKKGKTPREVVAQSLEYSSWAATLTYEDLNEIATSYFKKKNTNINKDLLQVYKETFYPDSADNIEITFNKNQKLYIIAEEISPVVREVSNYLRTKYMIDINCLEYKVSKSKQGEYVISTEKIVGYNLIKKERSALKSLERWSHPEKVKDIIINAIKEKTKDNYSITFTPSDIIEIIVKQYPDMNKNTARCQIISNCVNHPSRKYYSGGKDLCFRINEGVYRLYNSETDGKWNSKGEKIS